MTVKEFGKCSNCGREHTGKKVYSCHACEKLHCDECGGTHCPHCKVAFTRDPNNWDEVGIV